MPDRPGHPGHAARHPGGHSGPLHFGASVILSKEETFVACQALADAGRVLVRSGGFEEADTLGSLFELLEERLVAGCTGVCHPGRAPAPDRTGRGRIASVIRTVPPVQPSFGSNSRESELTQ